MWLDDHLKNAHLSDSVRAALGALRRKALAGKLKLAEFQAMQRQLGRHAPPLRAVLSGLRSVRKRMTAVDGFPADLSAEIDRMIERLQKMLHTTIKVASLRGLRSIRV
jgi:hypothetical protein